MIEHLLLAAILLIAAGGAAWDIRKRQIPNWLCLCLAGFAATYSFALFGWAGLGWAAIHASIALLVGMAFFAIGALGGGDAKFYTGGALSLQFSQALPMLAITLASGLLLLLVMVIGRRFVVRTGYSIMELRTMELPYGVAIATGLAVTLLFY